MCHVYEYLPPTWKIKKKFWKSPWNFLGRWCTNPELISIEIDELNLGIDSKIYVAGILSIRPFQGKSDIKFSLPSINSRKTQRVLSCHKAQLYSKIECCDVIVLFGALFETNIRISLDIGFMLMTSENRPSKLVTIIANNYSYFEPWIH